MHIIAHTHTDLEPTYKEKPFTKHVIKHQYKLNYIFLTSNRIFSNYLLFDTMYLLTYLQ